MKRLHVEIETITQKIKNLFARDSSGQKDHLQRDIANVALSATLLQISEFEFFKRAYFQWYGREIPESDLEYIFAEYMFKDVVPHYVRNFARKVLLLFHEGTLNPEKFNIIRPSSTSELRSAGIGYIIMLALILIMFCLLITDYVPLY